MHRCGRTARAGNRGLAVSLVQPGQAAAFASLRAQLVGGRSGNDAQSSDAPSGRDGDDREDSGDKAGTCAASSGAGQVDVLRVGARDVAALRPHYQRCLSALGQVVASEKRGDLRPSDAVSGLPVQTALPGPAVAAGAVAAKSAAMAGAGDVGSGDSDDSDESDDSSDDSDDSNSDSESSEGEVSESGGASKSE